MEQASGRGRERLERLALTIAATLVTVNIWTGAPLLARASRRKAGRA